VGDAGQVFEALAASFVEGLDEEDRSLLHEAAHLERITPELCEVCLGLSDAQARLRRIAAMNLFLDHRPGDDVYRMHGLFKRYLTEGGTASRPFGAEQHRLAAESFRNSSDVVAEIRHWVAAGDLERACARLVEEAPALALAARWHTLADLVTRFEMANDGELPVALARYMAKAQVAVGDAKAAVATITRAVGLPDLSEEDLVALYITRSYAHRSWGAMDRALRDAESALGHAEVLGPAERVRALRVIGQTHASELHLSVAGRCFAEAIELAERHHLARARAMLALDLAAYDLLCGRIDEAKESALLAASLGDELNYVDAQLFARNNLAAALHLGGDYTTAHDVFEEVLRDARRHGHRRVEALAWLGQGDLRSDLKLADSAEQCFQRGLALAREMGDADLIAYALRSLASHHRAAGDLAESRRLLSDPDAREPRADKHSNILHAIADAALRLGEGNSAMAIDQLREAAETLASAGALVSLAHAQLHLSHALFISEGIAAAVPTLESLVVTIREIGSHQFLALPADGMPRMWGALDAAGRPDLRISITEPDLRPRISPQLRGLPPTARPDDPHPRLLSPRERELVIALCEGLTRDAIADRVGLSRSTIDKTISGAYASTGFRHAYQLVGWAFRCGLFDLSDPPPPQTATHL
jgi:ATP/maltotriose-dependent transcriptional regulator MalT